MIRHADSGGGGMDVEIAAAEEFLRRYHRDHPGAGSLRARLAEVRSLVERYGSYQHTRAELRYGVRLAWRAAAPPPHRELWRGVRVVDRRHVTAAPAIADEVTAHLRGSLGEGRIRPVATVFAPDAPGRSGPRIATAPLPGHAGHVREDGTVLGDRRAIVVTAALRRWGWGVTLPDRFDPLPVLVSNGSPQTYWRTLPTDAVRQVPLQHPRYRWFGRLGLCWPALADIPLTPPGGRTGEPHGVDIGGVHYPAVLASCWHVGADIARQLADPDGYDVLPEIARLLGIDRCGARSLWRDQAFLELNIAILYSFDLAGITVSDHHIEAERARRRRGWNRSRAFSV